MEGDGFGTGKVEGQHAQGMLRRAPERSFFGAVTAGKGNRQSVGLQEALRETPR